MIIVIVLIYLNEIHLTKMLFGLFLVNLGCV